MGIKRKAGDAEVIRFECGVSAVALTKGRYALIDTEDEARILRHAWTYDPRPKRPRGAGYAQARACGRKIYMHREVLGLGAGECADHINREGLDNRKANLRRCSPSVNLHNKVAPNKNKRCTRLRGVEKCGQRFRARTAFNGKRVNLGMFDSEEQAAVAHRQAVEAFIQRGGV